MRVGTIAVLGAALALYACDDEGESGGGSAIEGRYETTAHTIAEGCGDPTPAGDDCADCELGDAQFKLKVQKPLQSEFLSYVACDAGGACEDDGQTAVLNGVKLMFDTRDGDAWTSDDLRGTGFEDDCTIERESTRAELTEDGVRVTVTRHVAAGTWTVPESLRCPEDGGFDCGCSALAESEEHGPSDDDFECATVEAVEGRAAD